ncbi:17-beta-hydroxysteroid dehydrogenase type 6 [Microtus ochrogaster]|uniref:17-beta-hydroxysteroid dehydrogenase type 6 n=1 Tax=Microtus ochrogaster TaxID=79684 RepID=A0A8J6G775_MICOH|nr:17-beta-hydroxysteroid dehydrogenase type 6 [Microtus ochrogaster]
MWFYLVTLVGLYYLLRWYRERQVVSNLQDKHVFITGCDSGFGNLLARQLDRRGMRVLAACLTEKGAEELRNKTSDRLETVILDVTKTESIVAATQWVKERVGNRGLWGLVNNAAVFPPISYIEWLKPEDYMSVFQVNLVGLAQVTLSMLFLVKKAQGRIVNVSSVLGRVAFFGGFYSCSKYGVEAFSDILRVTKQNLMMSNTNLNVVTDCMEHALTSMYPRTRYSAGWDAQFIFIPLSYLPTSLADYILTRSRPKPAQAA